MASERKGLQSILPYKLPTASELIYVKTNIAGYFFDAFMEVQHSHKSKLTNHPVQSGANITDHIYVEPVELNMTVRMSDCMWGLTPENQFGGYYSRSVGAYHALRDLQKARIPIRVVTRLEIYENMVIETLSALDDVETLNGLEAKVTMRQIIVANVQTIKISNRTNVTSDDNIVTSNVVGAGSFKELRQSGEIVVRGPGGSTGGGIR